MVGAAAMHDTETPQFTGAPTIIGHQIDKALRNMIRLTEVSTRGRLGPSGFWLRHLTFVPLALWAAIAAGQSPGAPYDLALVLVCLALLISIWGRRLHDRGHSAWWLLGVCVPIIGAVVLIVECGLRGTVHGSNRYGTEPGTRDDYLCVRGAPNQTLSRQ